MRVSVADLEALDAPASSAVSSPSPTDFDAIIEAKAKEHGVDPQLVRAVIQAESSGNPRAVSEKGAQGLMQLMPDTAKRFGVTDAFDPAQNIGGGVQYLKTLGGLFPNRRDLVLAAYNAGEGAVQKHGGIPPYPETQAYVQKVLKLHGGNGTPQPSSSRVTVADLESLDTQEEAQVSVAQLEALDRPPQPGLLQQIVSAVAGALPQNQPPDLPLESGGTLPGRAPSIAPPPTPDIRQQAVQQTKADALGVPGAGITLPSAPEQITVVPPQQPQTPESQAAADVALRRAGSATLPGRTILQSLRESKPGVALTSGLAGQSPEAILAQIFDKSGVVADTAEALQEELGANPTALDKTLQAAGSLLSPASIALFALNAVNLPIQTVKAAMTRVFGERVATHAMAAAAQRAVAGGTSFGGYNAITNALQQTERAKRTGQPASVGELVKETGKGVVTGAVLGPTALIPGRVARKAAEIGVFTTVPPLLEGRGITLDDAVDAGLIITALGLAHAIPKRAADAIQKPRAQRTAAEQATVEQVLADPKAREALDDAFAKVAQGQEAEPAKVEAEVPKPPAEPAKIDENLPTATQVAAPPEQPKPAPVAPAPEAPAVQPREELPSVKEVQQRLAAQESSVREAYPDIIGARLQNSFGGTAVIHKGTTPEEPIRVTWIDDKGPSGHTVFQTAEKALRETLLDGYTTVIPPAAPPRVETVQETPPAPPAVIQSLNDNPRNLSSWVINADGSVDWVVGREHVRASAEETRLLKEADALNQVKALKRASDKQNESKSIAIKRLTGRVITFDEQTEGGLTEAGYTEGSVAPAPPTVPTPKADTAVSTEGPGQLPKPEIGVRVPEGEALSGRSFADLAKASDAIQVKIDARHDVLDRQGVSFKQQLEDPELKGLYAERVQYDTAAAQRGYNGAKAILTEELKGLPDKTTEASHESILREIYSLTDKPSGGVYFMSKYTSKALENPETVRKLAEQIAPLILAKEAPGADYFATMESPAAGITSRGKARIIQEAAERAQRIHERIGKFFFAEQRPETAVAETEPKVAPPAPIPVPEPPAPAAKESPKPKTVLDKLKGKRPTPAPPVAPEPAEETIAVGDIISDGLVRGRVLSEGSQMGKPAYRVEVLTGREKGKESVIFKDGAVKVEAPAPTKETPDERPGAPAPVTEPAAAGTGGGAAGAGERGPTGVADTPFTRTTPAPGTPDRVNLEARLESSKKAYEQAHEKLNDLRKQYGRAKGAVEKRKLGAQIKDAEREINESHKVENEVRPDWITAQMEDAAEQTKNNLLRLAARHSLAVQRDKASRTFDRNRYEEDRPAIRAEVERLAKEVDALYSAEKDKLTVEENAAAIQSAVDNMTEEFMRSPLLARDNPEARYRATAKDRINGEIYAQRVNKYRNAIRKEMDEAGAGYSLTELENAYDIKRIDQIRDKAIARVREEREQEAEQKITEAKNVEAARERVLNPTPADRLAAKLADEVNSSTRDSFRQKVERFWQESIQTPEDLQNWMEFQKVPSGVRKALAGANPADVKAAVEILGSSDGIVRRYVPRQAELKPTNLVADQTRWRVETTFGDQVKVEGAHGFARDIEGVGTMWTNGHIAEVGEPPKGLKIARPTADYQGVTEDGMRALLDVPNKTVTLTPVARKTGSGQPTLVILRRSDGALAAVDAKYYDHFATRHPNAEWVQGPEIDKKDGNIGIGMVWLREDGKAVGVVMPMRFEVTPAMRVLAEGVPGTAPAAAPTAPAKSSKKGKGVRGFTAGSPAIPTSLPPATPEPISTGEVVQRLSDAFQVPVRKGHFLNRALGIYKQLEQVARIKGYGDIAVAAHEVAHHLDKDDLIRPLRYTAAYKELKALDYKPKRGDPHEGFAEFLRHYLTRDDAQTVAPKMYDWWVNEFLPKHPAIAEAVAKGKAAVDQWRQAGAVQRVIAQIDTKNRPLSGVKAFLQRPRSATEWLTDNFFNRLAPLLRTARQMTGASRWGTGDVMQKMEPAVNFWAYAKATNMTGAAKARAWADFGMSDAAGNKVAPALKEVLAPIAKDLRNPKTLEEFYAYTYARHALDVLKQGKNPGITKADAQYTVQQFETRPGWEAASDGLTQWHAGLVDYLVEAGGLSPDAAAKMQQMYPHYIALARKMDVQPPMQGGPGPGSRFANLPTPIRRLKGSGREILPPLESALTYAERLIGLADKIRVGRMLVDAAGRYKGLGEIVEEVDPSLVPHSVTVERVAKQLEAAGADLSMADQDALLTFFDQSFVGDPKDNILTLYQGGKRTLYWVRPDLYKALVGLDKPYRLPRVLDATFGRVARTIRLGATGLRAGFSLVTNPLRDIQTAVLQSGEQRGDPASVALGTVRGIISDLTNNEVAQLWKRGGGEMAQPLGIDRRFLKEAVDELLERSPKDKALDWLRHPIDTLRSAFSITEAGPRLAEFEKALKNLGWKPGQTVTFEQYLKAQLAAQNVTVDFREGGALGMWVNQLTPFFNASLQGPARAFDRLASAPVSTLTKAVTWLTLPALGLWWAYKDEDWYKNLRPMERYRFWHVKLGDKILRIPRPFEWGHLFASIPEAVMDWAYRKDPQAISDAVGTALQDMIPSFVPGLIQPAIEVAANRDFYFNRPLIPERMQRARPEDQANPETTNTARAVGRLFGVPPIYVEHLVSEYTGGLARDVISGIETTAREGGALPLKGTRPTELTDVPVIGRLFVRGTHTRVLDDFYTRLEKAEAELGSAKLAKGQPPEGVKSEAHRLRKAADELADLRKRSRETIADTTLADAEKRQKLLDYHQRMVDRATRALQRPTAVPRRSILDRLRGTSSSTTLAGSPR